MRAVQLRFDKERGIYRDCKFCDGRGCLACPEEAEKAYREDFPDGPEPIATFKIDDPKGMERFKKMFGKDALDKAFGPRGGGVDELIKNAKEI